MQLPRLLPGFVLAMILIPGLVPAAGAEEAATPPDKVMMTNGSVVLGTVTSVRGGVLTVDTDFAGTLEIDLAAVSSVNTQGAVVMQLEDETVIEDQPLRIESEQVLLADAGGQELSRPLEELLTVNPEPWELGRGYKWSGTINFAWAMERGNSDIDELDYKLDTSWRSDDDRYSIKLNGEIDEANDVKNADNWTLIGKYDRFISDRSYWGLIAYAEEDEFADLNLRTHFGPYIGREFYSEPIFKFSGEVGLSFVDEDFITAEDQDYPGMTWALHMGSNYLGGDSRLYFDQLGIWNLDETSDVIVNTTIGLAFPLLWGLEAAAEVLLEYDSGAVEGVEELDETYAFRIGYTW